ncbi:MAG: hypothetical protein NT030_06185 [Candidatus Saganbacteria bacterium]|nr:hypothetical protein [Candidatus Saganbacteria bacterium]
MKKLFILFFSITILFSSVNISFASSYLDGTIMSDPLGAGKMDISGKIDCFIGSDIVNPFAPKPKWYPLGDAGLDSVTRLDVPLKFAYGVTNYFSVRVTVPYVLNSASGSGVGNFHGNGLGDIRLEGLFRFSSETVSMPSIAANFGIKFATGKYEYGDLLYKELPVGTGGTDYALSFIFGKKLGPFNGNALLGYCALGRVVNPPTLSSPPDFYVDPAGQLLYSLACAYKINESFEFGGELWGNSCGPEIFRQDGVFERPTPYSEKTQIYLSPYLTFMPSPGVSLRAAIDYPLSVQAAWQFADWMSWYKGTTVSVSGSIAL